MRTLNKKYFTSLISFGLNGLLVAGVIGIQSLAVAPTSAPLTIEDLIARDVTVVIPRVEEPTQPLITETVVETTTPKCGGTAGRWLACAVYFEARNQSLEGQFYVAQSILNRVEDSRWPNSVEGVIRQGEEKKNRCQYSFMCDGKPEHIEDMNAWTAAVYVASKAMSDAHEEATATCAHSYRADYVTNQKALRWFASLEEDETVGSHIFYCDKTRHS